MAQGSNSTTLPNNPVRSLRPLQVTPDLQKLNEQVAAAEERLAAAQRRTAHVLRLEEAASARLTATQKELETSTQRLAEVKDGKYSWVGENAVPDDWNVARTVDVRRPGAERQPEPVFVDLTEVIDPRSEDASLRHHKRQAGAHPLTGQMGARGLQQYVTSLTRNHVARGTKSTDVLVQAWDVSNFKRINDLYTRETGDAVIRAVVGAAGSAIRQLDLDKRENGSFRVAHTRGDEFFIIGQAKMSEEMEGRLIAAMQANFDQRFDQLVADHEANIAGLAEDQRPDGVDIRQETLALRFGSTTIHFEPNLGPANPGHGASDIRMTSGEMATVIANKMAAAGIQEQRAKGDLKKQRDGVKNPPELGDRREASGPGEEFNDHRREPNDKIGRYVMLRGRIQDLVMSERVPESFDEVAKEKLQSVSELHLSPTSNRGLSQDPPSQNRPGLGRSL